MNETRVLRAGDIELMSKADLKLRVRELLTAEDGYCKVIEAAKEREAALVGALKKHACKCTGRCAAFEHLPADNRICLDRATALLLDTHVPGWRTTP